MVAVNELRGLVREAYSAAARAPQAHHAFPLGRRFAASLGYPEELLASLPPASVEAFSGVSNVSLWAEIPAGAAVLDLGCGAGMDAIIAARRAGPNGTVVGLDFSAAMLARARAAGGGVILAQADAEALPLRDASMDVALANGIFNLNPAREAIFRELARVVRPGGTVYAAELVMEQPLPREQHTVADWFA
jgi:arsenite methyltransferase